MSDFFLPVESDFLSFDLSILEWNEGDLFALYWNDNLLMSFLTDFMIKDLWYRIFDIDISQYAGTFGILAFGLITAEDGIHSLFGVRNISIESYETSQGSVPEPPTFLLLATGFMGILFLLSRKNVVTFH